MITGITLVEPLLNVSSPEFQEHRNSQKTQLSEIYGLTKDAGCENCGEKGHRTWACPLSLNQAWDKANVKCAICGDKSHPTCDCPEKNNGAIVNKETNSSEMENAYAKLMKEIRNDINNPTGQLMLEEEKKGIDIRDSVLWTGILPKSNNEGDKKETELKDHNEEYESDDAEDRVNGKKVNVNDLADPNENEYRDIHENDDIEINMEYEKDDLEFKINRSTNSMNNLKKTISPNYVDNNYERFEKNTSSEHLNNTSQNPINLPSQAILINNNIRQSEPINNLNNLNQTTQHTNSQNISNYYNTYINPYAFQNQAFNMLGGNNITPNYSQSHLSQPYQPKMPLNYTFSKLFF